MTKYPVLLSLLALLVISSILISCSKSESPVSVNTDQQSEIIDLPESNFITDRSAIAVYDAIIDPVNETFTIEPVTRTSDFHFPLTNMYPNVLQIVGYSFGPPFTADIKLIHPYPTSEIYGYDARVIACFTANPGVSATYTQPDVLMNNRILVDPDGYTKLFDNAGIPGNTNPFVAYFKDKPNREWGSSTATIETKKWYMDISGFGGPLVFKLVVDVSTNFPAPSQPVIDNCPEPYKIEGSVGLGLVSKGGSATIDVTLYDWQGVASVGGVQFASDDIALTGSFDLTYQGEGPEADSYLFSGQISNNDQAPAGDYKGLVIAFDLATGVSIYQEIPFTITPIPFELIEETAPQLNFSPMDIEYYEDYLYVAGGDNGFHVFYAGDTPDLDWVHAITDITPKLV